MWLLVRRCLPETAYDAGGALPDGRRGGWPTPRRARRRTARRNAPVTWPTSLDRSNMCPRGAGVASPHPGARSESEQIPGPDKVADNDAARSTQLHDSPSTRSTAGAPSHRGGALRTAREGSKHMTADTQAPTTHQGILDFVNEVAAMTQPDSIHWCTGSDEEWTELTTALVSTGTFTQLNPAIKRNSYYAASDPIDVARVEDRTYICSVDEKDCGPTNNWMDPEEMKAIMRGLYQGCMRGRTMYVIPFVMGHLEAEKPMFGVEITDSAYVTASMRVMARMGSNVLRRMEELQADF